jgi:plasmid segregation protein ParM
MNTHAPRKHLVIQNSAIDIGFHQVKIATARKSSRGGSEIHTTLYPSFAPSILVNSFGAMNQLSGDPDGVTVLVNSVAYFVGRGSMRYMDASGTARANNDLYCKSDQYKALFLGALWHLACHHDATGSLSIRHMVLGLPFTTLLSENHFVHDLARGVHAIPSPLNPQQTIEVRVEDVNVVAQPQGAVVHFSEGEGRNLVKPDHQLLVLDFGGGTFDWFVCNGEYQPIYARCGAARLGTLKLAASICEQINPAFVQTPKAMERVDLALQRAQSKFEIGGDVYELSVFLPLVKSIISDALSQMGTKVGGLGDMDHILVTGGGANIVGRYIDTAFPGRQKVIRIDPDPVFSNVRGFFQISEMISGGL